MPFTRRNAFLKKKKKKKSMMGKYFCFVLFCFSISAELAQVLTVISQQRSFGSHDNGLEDDSTSNLRVTRESPMEFRECCKCVLPLHQNVKRGL